MPHAALCVSRRKEFSTEEECLACFNAARSIVCVGTPLRKNLTRLVRVSMPHAALCVLGPNADWIAKLDLNGFNAARSIVCVET